MTSDCTRIGRTSWVAGWANLRLLRLAVLPAAAAVLTVLLRRLEAAAAVLPVLLLLCTHTHAHDGDQSARDVAIATVLGPFAL